MQALLVFFIVFVFSLSASAQDKAWEKEWKEITAAARKEGKLVIATSPDQVFRNEIVPKFKERFGVNIEQIGGRSSETSARVRTERSAGVYSVDIFMTGANTAADILYAEKMIDPFSHLLILPDVVDGTKWKKGKPWFIDPEGKYILRPFSRFDSLFYINTNYVKPEELRTAKDLLNPKWKGKISTESPFVRGSGQLRAIQFYLTFGPEGVKKLYVDQQVGISRERRQFTDWLARGTYPICLSCRAEDVDTLRKDDFPIKEFFELSDMRGRIVSGPWVMMIANKAPNPNAARVFANWIVSKEGLGIYSKGYKAATLRTDLDESFLVPESIPKAGVTYFDEADWNWVTVGNKELPDKIKKILESK